jgi:ParB family transcriptional regulator, chromosome partitioning protein
VSTSTVIRITPQQTRHVDSLRQHPDQPRYEVRRDDAKIQEMADSIIEHGIIEPLVVTPDNFIIAGHRRRVASYVAREKTGNDSYLTVPVVVREVSADKAAELMLHENMQRESLSPLEEATAMRAIMRRRGCCVSDLARSISLPPLTVSQRLAILKCEPEVQQLYHQNDLPLGAAPFLSRVFDRDKQVLWAGQLARRSISLAKLKDLATAATVAPEAPRSAQERETAADVPAPKAAAAGRQNGGGPKTTQEVLGQLGERRESPTRAEAMAALGRALGKKISFVAIRSVVEAQCCACGMEGQAEVCRTCPFPRLILGMAGRAE